MRSIQQQDFKDFELLVVDDHSRDQSLAIISQWAKQDSRIKVLRNKGRGIVDALNSGIHHASNEYIARMDGDDIMQPDRLSRQIAALQQNPSLDLVACRVIGFARRGLHGGLQKGYRVYLDWQNKLLSHQQICEHMYVESTLAHPSVVFRRSTVLRLGAYRNGDFPEDYDLWLRMMHHGCRFAKLPQYLLFWRDGEKRASRTDARYQREKFDKIRANYLCRDKCLPRHRPVWFWGAGRRTRQRVAGLIRMGIKPAAWVDIDPKKIGQSIAGVPVYPPEFIQAVADIPLGDSEAAPLQIPAVVPISTNTAQINNNKPFIMVLVNNHGAKELIENFLHGIGYISQRDYLLVG